jgi:hypothetical protein
MKSARTLRLAPIAFVIGATVMVSGCNSSKTASTANSAAANTPAAGSAAAGDSAAPVDSGAAGAPVKATGGGKFCTELATAMNSSAAFAAQAGTDPKAQILAARAATNKIVGDAPGAIKSDVQLLVKASNAMYDALAKVNYDYSKLTPADTADLSAPDVAAAEAHLQAYVKGTCGIDLTGGGAAAASAAAAAAAGDANGAAAGSDVAANGSACDLATVAEVSAGAGKPMKLTGGADTICAFGAVDDPSFFMYVQVYNDKDSMATPLGIETGSDHIDGLGDDAFFNKTTGMIFVRKGDRGFSFTLPSLANLTDNPDAIKTNMVTLAKAAAARF